MKAKVHLIALGQHDGVREVEISDERWMSTPNINERLELVWYYSQNDNVEHDSMRSSMVGDIIETPGGFWCVLGMGFRKVAGVPNVKSMVSNDEHSLRIFRGLCAGGFFSDN